MVAEKNAPSVAARAAVHRALGDEHRLAILDALALSDHSPGELRTLTGLESNLLSFHLDVLEEAGLVARRRSQGDGRRRYVTLLQAPATLRAPTPRLPAERVAFVCTANSARSQLAAALWSSRTGRPAVSGGTAPADHVHPLAVRVAASHGLDLSDARPRHYDEWDVEPDLVVSVCDRARETPLRPPPRLHWSVPDPARGDERDFEQAWEELAGRVERLAVAVTDHDHRER